MHAFYLGVLTDGLLLWIGGDRDGVEWFFVKLHEKKVPVLIISGGLGGTEKIFLI